MRTLRWLLHLRGQPSNHALLVQRVRKYFSVKFGTVMEKSKISYQHWAIATYQFATNTKGISSMKLHRDLGITQKSAWFLVQRLRESWRTLAGPDGMKGSVEVGEKWVGGSETNKHADKKEQNPKVPVVGVRDRETGRIAAAPVPETTQAKLIDFVERHVESPNTKVYSDGNPTCQILKNHDWVNHKAGEYVRGKVHTNGIESFWALLERGYDGVFRHLSYKYPHRHINEFAGRLNIWDMDTIDMMIQMVKGMVGWRLTYAALIR